MVHRRYQQLLNGLPVEGGVTIEHHRNGGLDSVSGAWLKPLPTGLQQRASFTQARALANALAFVGASTYKWQLPEEEAFLQRETGNPAASFRPRGELVYYSSDKGFNSSPRLAYRFDIYAEQPLSRQYVYVDAISGRVLGRNSLLQEVDSVGTAYTGYSGQQTFITDQLSPTSYRLREAGAGGRVIQTFNLKSKTAYNNASDFTNSKNTWGIGDTYTTSSPKDAYALDAHFGAEKTYEFYLNTFGRNSIDAKGFALKSYVHYSRNYFNAFWDGSRMTYGDGSSSNGFLPLTSLDVCGHEITHGLTSFTANLNYSGESGALNEAFSDIFGTAIEAYARGRTGVGANADKWNWTLGEDFKYVIRDMVNPKSYGDPDTYQGTNWYTGTSDNGGVHTNSGVLNYWFALLTEGSGSGVEHSSLNIDGSTDTNDKGYQFEVRGLGLDKAQAIAYRTLVFYLSPTSNYSDARRWSLKAASDLITGNASSVQLTPEEIGEVAYAWNAVAVGGGTSATAERLFEGSASPDKLYGGHLRDVLIGRGGNDELWGNGGADSFVLADASTEFYAASGESATIKDFNPSEDSLQLKAGISYAFTTTATDTSLFRGDASTGDLLAVLSGANLGDGSFSSTSAAPTWAAFV